MKRKATSLQYFQKLLQYLMIQSLCQVTNIISSIERRGRFAQLIKGSKKKRSDKIVEGISDNKEQEYIHWIDKQEEEISILKSELKELNLRLDKHSKDTDLLRRLYEDVYIDVDGNPIDRGSEMK